LLSHIFYYGIPNNIIDSFVIVPTRHPIEVYVDQFHATPL